MKEIQHCKFSLFRLEKRFFPISTIVGEFNEMLVQNCMEYIETYDTLDEAKIAQKEYKEKTIILNSY